MARLFVALTPPETMADALLAIMGDLAGVRWQRRDQLHLTLDFMGDVAPQQMTGLIDALASISCPSFDLWCAGVGHFARSGSPIALWAGAGPADVLGALARKVRRAVHRAGVGSQAMPFVPHITLARLNRSSGAIDDFLASRATFRCAPAAISTFGLFESRLGPDGASYALVRAFPLSG